MRVRLITIFVIGFFCNIKAQSVGIQFEQGLNWQQIRTKAKKENKFIFVDCYATWCGPCKLMEKEVYSNEKVGRFFNDHFISIKVQSDTGKYDNEFVRHWYYDAHSIIKQLNVSVFPTYLFFSPDGEVVHRASGAINDSVFLVLASHAMNSSRQFYTRLRKFRSGKMPYRDMPDFSYIANNDGYGRIADSLVGAYIHGYLDSLTEEEFLCAIPNYNIDFLASFYDVLGSSDKIFSYLYDRGADVDHNVNITGFSQKMVDHVITKEEIEANLWPYGKAIDGNPDWKNITKIVEAKYSTEVADRNILNAELRWYNEKRDWAEVAKYTVYKIERYGLDTAGLGWIYTNNVIYTVIFEHSNNRRTLVKASKWMGEIINYKPGSAQNMDTYANLLYKLGRTKIALRWEDKAAALAPKDKNIQAAQQKMKAGLRTWD